MRKHGSICYQNITNFEPWAVTVYRYLVGSADSVTVHVERVSTVTPWTPSPAFLYRVHRRLTLTNHPPCFADGSFDATFLAFTHLPPKHQCLIQDKISTSPNPTDMAVARKVGCAAQSSRRAVITLGDETS